MRARTGIVAALLGALMIVAVACQGTGESLDGDTAPGGTTGTAVPVMVEAPAPIESVAINIAESFPPQSFLAVTSGLPNGCVEFGGYEVTGDGDTVTVTVTNMEPEDLAMISCTMVYGLVESNIALGSDFEPGVTYTVLVNDKSTSFTAQGEPRAGQVEEPAPDSERGPTVRPRTVGARRSLGAPGRLP